MSEKSPTQITKKIVGYAVVKPGDDAPAASTAEQGSVRTIMNEHISRPETLVGRTYKIEKSPASEHAMYVTINDIILDEGTEHEMRRPFEIFINSKNMDQFQWVVAMTRILSAVFRKGGDVSFLAEEMKAVFDPKGGYFKSGGYIPSLVAEIGQIIEKHLIGLGLLDAFELDPMAAAMIAEKRKALSEKATPAAAANDGNEEALSFPPNATMCAKCHQKAVVIMDGCATCLNCGNSKCG